MRYNELVSEVKLYRGHSKDKLSIQEIVWFSLEPDVATGYSKHREYPTVTEIDYDPINTADVGRSEWTTTISTLLSTILNQTDRSTETIESVRPLFTKLREKFGTVQKPIHKFWVDNPLFAGYLDTLGFDSIMTTEDGHRTVGILRKYL